MIRREEERRRIICREEDIQAVTEGKRLGEGRGEERKGGKRIKEEETK